MLASAAHRRHQREEHYCESLHDPPPVGEGNQREAAFPRWVVTTSKDSTTTPSGAGRPVALVSASSTFASSGGDMSRSIPHRARLLPPPKSLRLSYRASRYF